MNESTSNPNVEKPFFFSNTTPIQWIPNVTSTSNSIYTGSTYTYTVGETKKASFLKRFFYKIGDLF